MFCLNFYIDHAKMLSLRFYVTFSRVISAEQGKVLADSWRAVFVESSAKENKV